MNLSDLLSASGLPGLYKMVANRSNGLILQHIDSGKTKFASIRKHNFTPLETIAIYTEEDTVALEDVFKKIMEIDAAGDLADKDKLDDAAIKETFIDAVPDYDPDRVYLKDMKKVFAWYYVLKDNDLLNREKEAPVENEEKSEKD